MAEHGLYDLIQSVSELRDGHNGVVRALANLFNLKNRLGELMPPNQMQGRVAIYVGAPPPQAGPIIANLDVLGGDILNHLEELKRQAREVVPVFNEKLKAALKVRKFPRIVIPAD